MHINVSHINTGEVGESANFDIEGENPDIPDLEFVKPITGRVTITKLDEGLSLSGQAHLVFKLECQRCLDPYEHQADLALDGFFSQKPAEDEWPVTARGEIDLSPMIREEALVSIPIRQICREDCLGLCSHCGQRLDDGHQHEVQDLGNKPRIKKGK